MSANNDDDFWDQTIKGDKSKTEIVKTVEKKNKPVVKPEETKSTEVNSTQTVDDPFAETANKQSPGVEVVPEAKVTEETTLVQEETTIPTSPVNDPFAINDTTKASVEVSTEIPIAAPVKATPTQSSQLVSTTLPFGEKGLSQEEEFAKTKPASSGKNISFMIFGKKGTSKTATALGLPGRIFALSYDQQTKIIHEEFYNNDTRIEVWDAIEFFNSKDPETKLETATKTVEYSNWLLENPCIKFKPDWILIDGTERLTHVCEMAMRAQENLLPYEGVKNLNVWKYRNDLINNIVQRAAQIAKLGVVYTAYTNIETVTTAMGEEKREGPKWAGDIEQKTQIVIKTSSEKMQNGRAFVAEVESSKVSFIPTGRKIVVGERLNSGEIQNNIGIKGLFTPDGAKKYWAGGEC